MQTDTLIVGCGIAGATTALRLAQDKERKITIVTREAIPSESNSSYAQGGIVGRGTDDSKALLVDDVLRAGDGLSSPGAVEILAEEGPELLTEMFLGPDDPRFDRAEDGSLLYGLEGAHSRRRILHVGDRTGRAIMTSLLRRVADCPNIELLAGRTAVDLITFPHHSKRPLAMYEPLSCQGVYVYDETTRQIEPISAARTVLATGGLGQVYLNTSNPDGARGDGLAMAFRAGARIGNAEYVQFHPTTLHMPGTTKFLISEAVRGEGGRLLAPDGRPIMEHHAAEWRDLGPRDIVARAIYWEMLANDHPFVLLDIASHMPADEIRARFPQIHERCLEHGIDITTRPIPVVPSAHYSCGGVLVDSWGRTSVSGLYAVGEVSCTGVHGANRLASTSLLEGLVWGDRAAQHIRASETASPVAESDLPDWDVSSLRYEPDPALVHGDMQTIRNIMWHYVGLVRSEHLLNRALRELTSLSLNIEDFYRKARVTDDLLGLRNGVQAALIVAQAASRNRVSRGCHYREDSRQEGRGDRAPSNV